jgi:hypothetical protein
MRTLTRLLKILSVVLKISDPGNAMFFMWRRLVIVKLRVKDIRVGLPPVAGNRTEGGLHYDLWLGCSQRANCIHLLCNQSQTVFTL